MKRDEIIEWLREDNPERLLTLWEMADRTRQREVGNEVHLRGLIEFSNRCRRNCLYCGLRIENQAIERYLMSEEEIMECVHQAVKFGYGTVVLQSGEDYGYSVEWLKKIITRIKRESDLAVTLSVGERPENELREWKAAGADRYLLRFESSNIELLKKIHPPVAGEWLTRLDHLEKLRRTGYEIGSGVMIGIPGQTYSDLAGDLEAFQELELDMVGIGPFIPNKKTPLYKEFLDKSNDPLQAPNSEELTYKVIALTRLLCPQANIPSTTALATLNKAQGREYGLQRGANVVMPNITPPTYRSKYEIYPAKACLSETAEHCHDCMKNRIRSLGRTIGKGPGHSPGYLKKVTERMNCNQK